MVVPLYGRTVLCLSRCFSDHRCCKERTFESSDPSGLRPFSERISFCSEETYFHSFLLRMEQHTAAEHACRRHRLSSFRYCDGYRINTPPPPTLSSIHIHTITHHEKLITVTLKGLKPAFSLLTSLSRRSVRPAQRGSDRLRRWSTTYDRDGR